MLGYDISWAAFNIIEVMTSAKFTHKVSEHFLFICKKKMISFLYQVLATYFF